MIVNGFDGCNMTMVADTVQVRMVYAAIQALLKHYDITSGITAEAVKTLKDKGYEDLDALQVTGSLYSFCSVLTRYTDILDKVKKNEEPPSTSEAANTVIDTTPSQTTGGETIH